MTSAATSQRSGRRRLAAARVSLLVGVLVFAAKILGWQLTGSTAVLADALESIVNVVAAGFALWAIRFAAQPADRDHPYGHGKMELLSAAFEGGLVTFAAALSLYAAGRALVVGPELGDLDVGTGIIGGAAVVNLALGTYLVRVGEQEGSPGLAADGQHVLSDVWTSGGAIVALVLVRFTGLELLDPLAALVLAALLARTGVRLLREAAGGLLDREDPVLLGKLVDAFNAGRPEGVGGLHRLRALRAGELVHVDAHVWVDGAWSVARAHEVIDALERDMTERLGFPVEIALHLDPAPGPVALDEAATVERAVEDRPHPPTV